MQNISTQLADLAITRSLILQRLANGLSRQVANQYLEIIDDVTNQLKTNDDINIKNMNKIIKELKERMEINVDISQDLKDIGMSEAQWAANSVNQTVGIDLISKLPTENTIERIVNTSLMEGAVIADWYKSLDASMQVDLERSVKLGVSIGETTPQIVKRVKDKLLISRNQAESITRTAIATVSNEARQNVYDDNEDIFKGYEHISTIDNRTSSVCATRDGAYWDLEGKGLNDKGKKFPFRKPPLHFRCRSVLTPILKSYEDLGLKGINIPEGTRASMDGQISESATFEKWFESKSASFQEDYLGRGRYKLYKDGKITFSDLVNQQGRELTIEELKAKF